MALLTALYHADEYAYQNFELHNGKGFNWGVFRLGEVCRYRYSQVTGNMRPNAVKNDTPLSNDGLQMFPGCSIPGVTNVCGEGVACTPGPEGYICGERKKMVRNTVPYGKRKIIHQSIPPNVPKPHHPH